MLANTSWHGVTVFWESTGNLHWHLYTKQREGARRLADHFYKNTTNYTKCVYNDFISMRGKTICTTRSLLSYNVQNCQKPIRGTPGNFGESIRNYTHVFSSRNRSYSQSTSFHSGFSRTMHILHSRDSPAVNSSKR